MFPFSTISVGTVTQPLKEKCQLAGFYRKRSLYVISTERVGKAMHAVSGRDTADIRPEPASKKATTSLGMHGFARPLGGCFRHAVCGKLLA